MLWLPGSVPELFLEDVSAICAWNAALVKPGQPFQAVWGSPGKCKPGRVAGLVEPKFFPVLCHVAGARAHPAREELRGWNCRSGLWRFLLWWGLD